MSKSKLQKAIRHNQSFLCVGLDPDLSKLPTHFSKDHNSVIAFLTDIIDATAPYCCSYKLNFAFFEALGLQAFSVIEAVKNKIPSTHYTIADAKRGDIGNTASKYAISIFDQLNFDSVTVAPYMGENAVQPFLDYEDKGVIVLGLTSNESNTDFQKQKMANGQYLYQLVLEKLSSWASPEQLMFVIGATNPNELSAIRKDYPDHMFLVPGVGAQGGDLKSVCEAALTNDVGILINSSRGILYASNGVDYAAAAATKAQAYQSEMKVYL